MTNATIEAAIAALRAELARCLNSDDYERAGYVADGGLAVIASLVATLAPSAPPAPPPPAPNLDVRTRAWWERHVGRLFWCPGIGAIRSGHYVLRAVTGVSGGPWLHLRATGSAGPDAEAIHIASPAAYSLTLADVPGEDLAESGQAGAAGGAA